MVYRLCTSISKIEGLRWTRSGATSSIGIMEFRCME
nr:MAG TPA: hypothetical protein [Caudoviricetes sp.]